MGDPAGPGKMYCTNCGELIDRESTFCTYCGAETKDREFPTDRSGPATASDNRSVRRTAESNGGGHAGVPERRTGDPSERDYGRPRVGAEGGEQPRLDEPTWRAVGVSAGLGVAGVFLLAISSALFAVVLFEFNLPDLAVLGIATGLGQYVGFIGLGLWYLKTRGYDWGRIRSYLGVRLPTLKEIGLVLLGWIAILVLVMIVSIIVQAVVPTDPAENEGAAQFAEGATSPVILLGGVLFMFLVVGPAEELLYRGVVQNRLRERLPAVPAILVASFVFAAVHVVALAGGDPVAMATTVGILFVPSLVFGAIYEYTGNLVVPSLLHGLHNSFILTIIFFVDDLEEAAEFIAGLLVALPF